MFFVLSSFLLTLPFIMKGPSPIHEFLDDLCSSAVPQDLSALFLVSSDGAYYKFAFMEGVYIKNPIGVPFYLSVKDFIEHLSLTQGKGVTWSILAEFRYYFILPALALVYAIIFRNKLIPSITLTVILLILMIPSVSSFVFGKETL